MLWAEEQLQNTRKKKKSLQFSAELTAFTEQPISIFPIYHPAPTVQEL